MTASVTIRPIRREPRAPEPARRPRARPGRRLGERARGAQEDPPAPDESLGVRRSAGGADGGERSAPVCVTA